MRARIEKVNPDAAQEVVIYCREITPEVQALERLINQSRRPSPVPEFFKGDEQVYLNLREILFFETEAERVYAHTADDAFEVQARLYELESMLPGYFIRVSRSAIANILHVFSIQKGLTRVNLVAFRQSHKQVYCSRMYGKELFRKMNERYLYENT